MQRCAQMTRPFYPVASDSDADKKYEVRIWTPGEFPSCTCVSFKINKNKIANQLGGGGKGAGKGLAEGTAAWCKHLTYIEKSVCHWEQKDDADFRFDATCPKCHGPVVDDLDGPAVGNDAALADLLALREELTGKPVQVPTSDPLIDIINDDLSRIRGERLSPQDAAVALIKEMS